MPRTEQTMLQALLVLVAVAVLIEAVSLALQLRPPTLLAPTNETPRHRSSLPCEAVPVRFVYEAPACAQLLLETMNVTNVRIQPITPYTSTDSRGIAGGGGSP